jgi:hypothetical protein
MMPYIKQIRRDDIDMRGDLPANAGELNYAITVLCIEYLTTRGKCYASINNVLGALEGAKQEFYRRVAAPYEDTKIKDNGDVYP